MKFLDKETGTLGERIRTLFKEMIVSCSTQNISDLPVCLCKLISEHTLVIRQFLDWIKL